MPQLVTYASGIQNADIVSAADLSAGDFTTLGDGLPGYVVSAMDVSERPLGAKHKNTIAKVTKKPSMTVLAGQRMYWDRANAYATYDRRGNEYIGVACMSSGQTTTNGVVSAAADTYVYVAVGARVTPVAELGVTPFTLQANNGLSVTRSVDGSTFDFEFDAVAEAADAGLISENGVDVDAGPVFEAWIASKEVGDNAALDRDWGLASVMPTFSSTSDLEAIAAFITFHLDNDLNVDMQSDDGTTDRAPADTNIDMTDDTYHFFQLSLVDKTAPVAIIDGTLVATPTNLTLAAFTSTLYAIVYMEKTSDDTVGKTAAREVRLYSAK